MNRQLTRLVLTPGSATPGVRASAQRSPAPHDSTGRRRYGPPIRCIAATADTSCCSAVQNVVASNLAAFFNIQQPLTHSKSQLLGCLDPHATHRSPWRLVAESPSSNLRGGGGSSSQTPLSQPRRSPLGPASPGAAVASPAAGGAAGRLQQLRQQLLQRCQGEGGGIRVTVAKKRAAPAALPATAASPSTPALPPPTPTPELPAFSLAGATPPRPAAAQPASSAVATAPAFGLGGAAAGGFGPASGGFGATPGAFGGGGFGTFGSTSTASPTTAGGQGVLRIILFSASLLLLAAAPACSLCWPPASAAGCCCLQRAFAPICCCYPTRMHALPLCTPHPPPALCPSRCLACLSACCWGCFLPACCHLRRRQAGLCV